MNKRRFLPMKWRTVFGVCGVAALAAIIWRCDPIVSAIYPPCLLNSFTGLHCPGCGTARGLHALLNGRIVQAFAYNPLTVVVFPLMGIAFVAGLARNRGGRLSSPIRPLWLPWLILGVIIVFGVLRNISIYPFDLLAPHDLAP